MSQKYVVIVESPKKAKEISHFLGKDFVVRATVGHFKDLPENEIGVDLNTYEPKFVIKTSNHKKNLAEIKKMAENAEVIIATDPDREGYAIGYFMYQELKGKTKNIKRAEFREITKDHVLQQIKSAVPFEKTNFGLFNAFLGRRVGDRIVGYTLSPIASREIGGKFSVGRVQSPAVRLIVEREKEILNFKPTPYYVLSALLRETGDVRRETFTAVYEKGKINSKQEAEKIYKEIKDEKKAVVKKIEKKQVKQSPKPPFTTSTLQQTASSVYKFAPEKTMMLAQDLFESGLITYHRTDSVRISEKAIEEIRRLINTEFGKEYLPEKPKIYKSKNTQADAHEAIRITHFVNLEKQKELINEKGLTEDHFKLLKLIYERTVASQMADAIFDRTTAVIDIKGYTFKAIGTVLKFKGFKAIYGIDEEEEQEEDKQNLPDLKDNDVLSVDKIKMEEKFTQPPARYTEGSLVKKLEDLGIGRPSTYATIMKTIKDRGYVIKEKSGSLKPTESAFKLIEYLDNRYKWIIDYAFTKNMEDFLDEVEENKKHWKEFVRQLYESTGLKKDFESLGERKMQVSEKMLQFARDLAEKHGESIEDIKDDPKKLKEFIDSHIDRKPSDKQVEFAKSLAEKTGMKLTDKELSDKVLLSKWIDKAKEKMGKVQKTKGKKK